MSLLPQKFLCIFSGHCSVDADRIYCAVLVKTRALSVLRENIVTGWLAVSWCRSNIYKLESQNEVFLLCLPNNISCNGVMMLSFINRQIAWLCWWQCRTWQSLQRWTKGNQHQEEQQSWLTTEWYRKLTLCLYIPVFYLLMLMLNATDYLQIIASEQS